MLGLQPPEECLNPPPLTDLWQILCHGNAGPVLHCLLIFPEYIMIFHFYWKYPISKMLSQNYFSTLLEQIQLICKPHPAQLYTNCYH